MEYNYSGIAFAVLVIVAVLWFICQTVSYTNGILGTVGLCM
ncbi:hypothetical protein P6P90_07665 [Ectobacillus antri]|uniref:Uncharacterized protein n=1 Tax=Ectobacillus antri TaxID=2486280 RepID=A0ABT6H4U9_9BACI|nr:hypothetical protein [Ectobacillus antri]MDG4657535.1 hypothetical protein [Ectobacillus antri]MDG5753848.1 hypothetical protein [Ectobacillus antri]